MSRRIKFLLSGLFLIITFIFLTVYLIKSKENLFADEIISEASESFSSSLNNFLSSAQQSVATLNNNIGSVDSEDINASELNKKYSEMLRSEKYLEGIALSNNSFRYIIYRNNSSFTTTFDDNLTDSISNWRRLNSKLEVVSEWTDIATTFPSKNNFSTIEKKLQSTKYLWNVADNPIQGSKNIMSIIFNTQTSDNEKIIAGLVYNSLSISHNFASVLKYEEPLVSVLTSNNNIVTPVITSDSVSKDKYQKLEYQISEIVTNWKNETILKPQSFSFEKFNEVYWTRIIALTPKIGIEGFAVTISGADLAKTEQNQERF